MSDLKISEALEAHRLLTQLWNDPAILNKATWLLETTDLLGSSPSPYILCPGDKVELLVNGVRGQFKGEIGVVVRGNKNYAHIRVPGKIAPGEIEEYQGPYSIGQFKKVIG
jgi:hypothetical protein